MDHLPAKEKAVISTITHQMSQSELFQLLNALEGCPGTQYEEGQPVSYQKLDLIQAVL